MTTGTCKRRRKSRANWLAMRPAPSTPTFVTFLASQFALLFLRRLQVPVVITDLDQARVDKGLDYIRGEIAELEQKGRIDSDEGNRLRALVSGTVDKADFADCDWVIEAVFEELSIKQDVFAEVEKHISPEAVLATNTSSLSVEQIGAKLKNPERVVGFHFFNPVAVMPLIEVVKTPATDEAEGRQQRRPLQRGEAADAVPTRAPPGITRAKAHQSPTEGQQEQYPPMGHSAEECRHQARLNVDPEPGHTGLRGAGELNRLRIRQERPGDEPAEEKPQGKDQVPPADPPVGAQGSQRAAPGQRGGAQLVERG